MNDFTKEELQFLKHATQEHHKNHGLPKGDKHANFWDELIEKIQFMIDNYPKKCPKCNVPAYIYTFELDGNYLDGWACDECHTVFEVLKE